MKFLVCIIFAFMLCACSGDEDESSSNGATETPQTTGSTPTSESASNVCKCQKGGVSVGNMPKDKCQTLGGKCLQ